MGHSHGETAKNLILAGTDDDDSAIQISYSDNIIKTGSPSEPGIVVKRVQFLV